MFRIVVIALILVPALEIWGLFEMGKLIGGWQTFGLIVLTGFLGAWLARREGRKVWTYARQQLSVGAFPTDSILDGIAIFTGGLLLMSPGLITDVFGFLMVFPVTRPIFTRWILAIIRKRIGTGSYSFFWRE
ncbi:hypothetical protein PAESOLCIP111_05228 [Paenibacillus solanacearum]|uniref:FxsA family protein n=1 Tax=Paenibacillus solanacearum TaxID=2048548 RepID=A0A916K9D1_9BACL|nr:FxsA family protein [Paenibacillus solanacearum]CAG7646718.1 hypothetical protein PAESOLCIP111_05228 [Paenibacillus solanacearum]